ncbi:unnamed protein product [Caenorhabditis auriculariae]|uniref:Dimethylargininase n=1 Tax=Caenorhabditis auriculariae TaxID=2777116 RepID=A0A8S1H8D9_9PELO|nr:unnamed protein product [Caenorhabditis auriculariae]
MNSIMLGPAKRIMMCKPTHYQVKYQINPWMNVKRRADNERAQKQWLELKATIEKCGATVEVMEPEGAENLPDIVFCANAAIIRGKRAYVSHFAHRQREGEHVFYEKWLKSKGYQTFYNDNIRHEGTGDALWCSQGMNTLISGVGTRSDMRAAADIRTKMNQEGKDDFQVVCARLVDPRFYHIDVCFCPLNENLALFYPNAFDPVSQNNMKNYTTMLEVPEKDALKFACNAVVIGKNVILHEGAKETEKMLEMNGFIPHAVDMSEFLKAGGSSKCCTLRLE